MQKLPVQAVAILSWLALPSRLLVPHFLFECGDCVSDFAVILHFDDCKPLDYAAFVGCTFRAFSWLSARNQSS
jgi:hypothetical protein